MLAIRLRRTGSKKRPFFRVVVTEAKTPRDSRAIEILGFYNPRSQPETIRIDRDRFAHWVGSGAQPSATVRTLVDRMPEPVTEPSGAPAAESAPPEAGAAAPTPSES